MLTRADAFSSHLCLSKETTNLERNQKMCAKKTESQQYDREVHTSVLKDKNAAPTITCNKTYTTIQLRISLAFLHCTTRGAPLNGMRNSNRSLRLVLSIHHSGNFLPFDKNDMTLRSHRPTQSTQATGLTFYGSSSQPNVSFASALRGVTVTHVSTCSALLAHSLSTKKPLL